MSNITTSKTFDDTMGYLLKSTDGNGNLTTFEIDVLGRITGIIYPQEVHETNPPSKRIIYDDENLIVYEIKQATYNSEVNLISTNNTIIHSNIDNLDILTKYTFDNLSRLISVTKDSGKFNISAVINTLN